MSCTVCELVSLGARRQTRLLACDWRTTGVAIDCSIGTGGLHTRLGDPLARPVSYARNSCNTLPAIDDGSESRPDLAQQSPQLNGRRLPPGERSPSTLLNTSGRRTTTRSNLTT